MLGMSDYMKCSTKAHFLKKQIGDPESAWYVYTDNAYLICSWYTFSTSIPITRTVTPNALRIGWYISSNSAGMQQI